MGDSQTIRLWLYMAVQLYGCMYVQLAVCCVLCAMALLAVCVGLGEDPDCGNSGSAPAPERLVCGIVRTESRSLGSQQRLHNHFLDFCRVTVV
jgi:hypothetical protein